MKIINLVNAVPAINKLLDISLPRRQLYDLSKKIKRINEELEFYRGEFGKLCKKYEGKYTSDPEYIREVTELNEFEVDVGEVLTIAPIGEFSMTYKELCLLDGIIEIQFEETEEKCTH